MEFHRKYDHQPYNVKLIQKHFSMSECQRKCQDLRGEKVKQKPNMSSYCTNKNVVPIYCVIKYFWGSHSPCVLFCFFGWSMPSHVLQWTRLWILDLGQRSRESHLHELLSTERKRKRQSCVSENQNFNSLVKVSTWWNWPLFISIFSGWSTFIVF